MDSMLLSISVNVFSIIVYLYFNDLQQLINLLTRLIIVFSNSLPVTVSAVLKIENLERSANEWILLRNVIAVHKIHPVTMRAQIAETALSARLVLKSAMIGKVYFLSRYYRLFIA